MEQMTPPFVAPNLTELPHSLFLDFTAELLPMRNLIVEFHPYFTERDLESAVKRLFRAITYQNDIEYSLAEFSAQLVDDFLTPYNCASQAKLFEVQQRVMAVGFSIFNKINGMSGYVSGVFPYSYSGMKYGSEVFLRNLSTLNYDIELNSRPFQFAI